MDGLATRSRSTYGSVSLSDNTRAIVGDHIGDNIQIESATIILSCASLSDIDATSDNIVRHCNRISITPTYESATPFDGDRGSRGSRGNRERCIHLENGCFEAGRQNTKNVRPSRAVESTHMQELPASTVTASTTDERRKSKFGALTSDLSIVPEPVVETNNRTSMMPIAQDEIAHQGFKGPTSCSEGTSYFSSGYCSQNPHTLLQDLGCSVVFEDDLTKASNFVREDRQYRIFFLRRNGLLWTQSICSESFMPTSQIKDRVKHGPTKWPRKNKQNIKWTLERVKPPRKHVIEHLLQHVNRSDPCRDTWAIVAIDTEHPKITGRTGEVVAFSMILERRSEESLMSFQHLRV